MGPNALFLTINIGSHVLSIVRPAEVTPRTIMDVYGGRRSSRAVAPAAEVAVVSPAKGQDALSAPRMMIPKREISWQL